MAVLSVAEVPFVEPNQPRCRHIVRSRCFTCADATRREVHVLYRPKSIALFGPLLCATAFLAAANRSTPGLQDDELPAPTYWVAFDADVRETQAGAPEFTG